MEDYKIAQNVVTNGSKSITSVKRLIKWGLQQLNVPFYDPCCKDDASNPMRVNREGVLQSLVAGKWVDVPLESDPPDPVVVLPTIFNIFANYISTEASWAGNIVVTNMDTDVTIFVTDDLPMGFYTTIIQGGEGIITIQADGGFTGELNNRQDQFRSAGKHAMLTLISSYSGTPNKYVLGGDTQS